MEHDGLASALERLSPKDRYLVTHRFGFAGAPSKSLRELGAELGISPQRCRRLVARALGRLNAGLREPQAEGPSLFPSPRPMESHHASA